MSVEEREGAGNVGALLQQFNWPATTIVIAILAATLAGGQMWGQTQETVRQQAAYSAQLEARIQRLETADKELGVVLTQVRVDLAGIQAELRALRLSIDRKSECAP